MYNYKAKVTRVIDGDTIEVMVDLGFNVLTQVRLRLLGVDTPELRSKDASERRRAKEAVTQLEELGVRRDAKINIHSRKTGKYGRWLADVYVKGKWINESLRELGHGS